MKLVIIESPFAADTKERAALHLRYARAALRDSLNRGEAPFASHLLYTQVLDDSDPDERADGIEAGLMWGTCATTVAVYEDLGISPGMQLGIDAAEDRGTRVEHRRLDPATLAAVMEGTIQLRRILATTRALETAVAELDSARFARDRYANTIGLIESAIGFSGASPVEETIERVRRLKAERDSAITRAEKAESERDEARGEARAHRAALDDATAACHGLGCGRCEDCVSLQRERAEKAEAERYIALAKAKWAAS